MVLRDNNIIGECCNMTIGYHNSIGSNTTEFIDTQEAYNTLWYVASIIKNYEFGETEYAA